jgi:galactose mutarotase-like enzyme
MPLRPCREPYPHQRFEDGRGNALSLVPERGGLVTAWSCGGQEMLYFDAERFADPSASVRGGIPILFPICGGLPGGLLPLRQGDFQLPQHGFARDRPWALEVLEGEAGVRLVLEDDAASRACFPFAFRLELALRTEADALAIDAHLLHRGAPGDDPLPFSLGLHPYLAVSDPGGVRLEGLPATCLDQVAMAEASTAERLAQLADGVDLLTTASGAVRLVDPGLGRSVTLELEPPLDRVVIWSDPPRPMVCLEPWSGPRGALISGDGRLELPPGASMRLGCRYRVAAL